MNKPKLDKAKQWLLTVPPKIPSRSANFTLYSAKARSTVRHWWPDLADSSLSLAESCTALGGTEKKKTPIVDQVKALRKLGWQESVERAAKENNLTTQQVWDEITRQKLAWRAKTGKLF